MVEMVLPREKRCDESLVVVYAGGQLSKACQEPTPLGAARERAKRHQPCRLNSSRNRRQMHLDHLRCASSLSPFSALIDLRLYPMDVETGLGQHQLGWSSY